MYEYKFICGKTASENELTEVANNNWNYPYAPRVTASMGYVKGSGLSIRLTAYESDPFVRYTKNYDPVYTDSCLECFINPCPEKGDTYINLETNANGAFINSFAPGRENRQPIVPLFGIEPSVVITKEKDRWIADILLSDALLSAVYGKDLSIEPGKLMKGNFYKCQEDGENPHFLSWTKIDTPKPDFHRPEYFGNINVL